VNALDNVTTARKSPTTRLINALKHRYIASAQKRRITTAPVLRQSRSVLHVAGPTKHLAEAAGNSTYLSISRILRILQLNVRKQGTVHDSLMNDKEIQDATVLAIQELQARIIQDRLLTTPISYYK
jgi:hypothetical protein